MEPVDAVAPDVFASIMRSLPAGVAIVTTVDDHGEPRGLTTSAVCSVSAEPPLLLVCVDRSSRTLPTLRAAGAFAVNFMRADATALCARFASKARDKFAGVPWNAGTNGMPVLTRDATAWAECSITREIPAGDHVILLASVQAGMGGHPSTPALVYYHRRYGYWAPTESARAEVA
jgi:flavin reductase (DIM6/NTAB) family NADH-FMN oxidoreductase RutF